MKLQKIVMYTKNQFQLFTMPLLAFVLPCSGVDSALRTFNAVKYDHIGVLMSAAHNSFMQISFYKQFFRLLSRSSRL